MGAYLSLGTNDSKILLCGIATADESSSPPSSPPSPGAVGTVEFETPFPGLGEEHCVILTTLNGGSAYVIDMDDRDLDGDDEDDHFTGFSFLAENNCSVMFIVLKADVIL